VVHELQDEIALLNRIEDCRHRIEREAIQDGSYDLICDEAFQLEAHLRKALTLWKRAQNNLIRLLEAINAETMGTDDEILGTGEHGDSPDRAGLHHPERTGRENRAEHEHGLVDAPAAGEAGVCVPDAGHLRHAAADRAARASDPAGGGQVQRSLNGGEKWRGSRSFTRDGRQR